MPWRCRGGNSPGSDMSVREIGSWRSPPRCGPANTAGWPARNTPRSWPQNDTVSPPSIAARGATNPAVVQRLCDGNCQRLEPPDRLDAVDVEAAGTGCAGGDDGVIEDGFDDR